MSDFFDPASLSNDQIVAAVTAKAATDPGLTQKLVAAFASTGALTATADAINADIAGGQIPAADAAIANVLAGAFTSLDGVLAAPSSLPGAPTVGAVVIEAAGGNAPGSSGSGS